MKPPYLFYGQSSGFTLIEFIGVMVIMGVLSAIAAPKFFDRSIFDNNGFHDQIVSSLRYAQKEAIAQHGFVCVAYSTNSLTLTVGQSNACGTALANPAGLPIYVVQSSKASFLPIPSNFSFDCMGIPRTTGQGTCSDVIGVLTNAQTVQVQGAAAITVEMETGYVH